MPESAEQPQDSQGRKQWFLRIDDGSLFGPVQLDMLRRWAADGRVAPGNEVSQDKTTWVPAESVEELEMVWMVELQDGAEYGPVHLRALADLILNGTVSRDATLTDRRTSETTTVEEKTADIFAAISAAPVVALAQTEA